MAARDENGTGVAQLSSNIWISACCYAVFNIFLRYSSASIVRVLTDF